MCIIEILSILENLSYLGKLGDEGLQVSLNNLTTDRLIREVCTGETIICMINSNGELFICCHSDNDLESIFGRKPMARV